MSRGYLVFDIETVPDLDLYAPQEAGAGKDKGFPPLWAHRPIVIGVLWLDADYGFKRLGIVGEGKDEGEALADFGSFVDRERSHLVSFNGRSFDLPVIALRSLRHGVPLRFYYQERDYQYRYSDAGHIDLCDALAAFGATRSMPLNALARLIGLPGKVGVDGSQVEGLYNAGQLETIKNYCLADVAQTAYLFLRYRLLQGIIGLEDYRRIATALLDAFVEDGRLEPIIEQIDRPRLLLEA